MARSSHGTTSTAHDPTRAGTDLGLPPDGPGSMASVGRRLVAVLIDWFLSQAAAVVLFDTRLGSPGTDSLVPLAIFAVANIVLLSFFGSTVGMRVVGIRVGSLGRPMMSPLQVIVRTLLLCLFIPAVIWDSDGRGLHDKAAGTVIVRR